ncbi:hypothetical protein TCE0_034f10666 [Talaromyces pinophilus]|uniref:Uncharacterized protein n=1 Tax=Talaromyces pinophilus TaxID=128442 RepID=A0A6V8HL86_TALPI|nr:Hypothetical protein PENO1_015440 [Penicillium occitanis (nom. inval.)]PCH07752.1 hypothetical protein PENOC_017600 [Penicillium occitanis (nom. inval.)]GAM39264.1 hypothetical protein TCE0_034f10666 [Talaromyces pinophilus]
MGKKVVVDVVNSNDVEVVKIEGPSYFTSRVSKIPRTIRFSLVILSSLVLSSVLLTVFSLQTAGHLAGISKHLEEWWEITGLILWRATELGLAWVFGFDSLDVAELTLLTHAPIYFLLYSFYGVEPSAVLTTFAIEIVSKTVPFFVFRGPNSVHALSSPRGAEVANREILQDYPTAIFASGGAAAIYTIVMYLSFNTWLPVHLVTYFDGISDISLVHSGPAGFPKVLTQLLLIGYAAYDFLFASSAGWSAKPDSTEKPAPEGEYLITSLYKRTWGKLSPKGKILANRSLILATITLLNTIIAGTGSIKGIELMGSVGWGSLWAVASLIVSSLFAWIEAVPGV